VCAVVVVVVVAAVVGAAAAAVVRAGAGCGGVAVQLVRAVFGPGRFGNETQTFLFDNEKMK
jgi:hypothetical protein